MRIRTGHDRRDLTRRRARSIAALTTVGGLVVGGLLAAAPASAAELSFPYRNVFQSASGLQLNGTAAVAGGWATITPAAARTAGAIALTDTFPSALGITVSFDYATYGGSGNGGDGFSMYLADGSSPIGVGGAGGNLGYAGNPGIPGGYVGIGFDEFGGFAAGNGGPGQRPNAVTVRGSGNAGAGYAFRATAPAPGGVPTGSRAGARSVQMSIIPESGTGDLLLSVAMSATPGGPLEPVISDLDLSNAAGQAALPAQLRLGFGGSTGSALNAHEVSNLAVEVPTDLAVTKTATAAQAVDGAVQYVVTAENLSSVGVQGAAITDDVPASVEGVTWTCAASGGAVCAAATGSGNVIATSADLPGNSRAVYTVNGTLAASATGTITNRAEIAAPSDRVDTDSSNNAATASTTVRAAPAITVPAADALVATLRPALSGTGVDGDSITVRNDAGDTVCTSAVVGGVWSCTPTSDLLEGANTLIPTATTSDAEVQGQSVSFTVDTTAPAEPTITLPADGSLTNDATPTFTGTGDEGDRIELRADDGTVLCSVVVPAGGAWTCTPTAPFGQGGTTVTPVAVDVAGNETAGTPVTITVDTTPPAVPTDVVCVVNGNGSVSCTGTGAAVGDEIVVRDGDGNEVCRVTVPAGLDWSCTTAAPVTAFPLTVVEVDPAGNESPAVITASPAAITRPTGGSPTNDTTPTFTGTGAAGDTVQLRDAAGNTVCETTVAPDGAWTCTPTAPLPEGPNTITPVVVGADGTELVGTPISLVVDTSPPPAASNVVCEQNANGTVTCSGTAEPGSTVRIMLPDGTEVCTVRVIASGQWTCTTPVWVDADRLLVTVTDPAGNVSSAVAADVATIGSGGSEGSGGTTPDGAGELAFTGADLTGLTAGTLALLLLGTFGLWGGARRRHS